MMAAKIVLLAVGLATMVAGVCIRPKGQPVQWSKWWGHAGASTGAGKAVYVVGGIIFFFTLYSLFM